MLQDKLSELVRSSYNIKIIVAGTYKAKETLAAKGLTPAVFLDRFYRQKSKGPTEIVYSFKDKEKYFRPIPDFVCIDYEQFQFCRRQDKDSAEDLDEIRIAQKINRQLHQEQIKYHRNLNKDVFSDRLSIEKFLNNQSFHWFDRANKYFFYSMSFSQAGYRVGTIDQPLSVAYVIQVQKNKTLREVFDKVKKDVDRLLNKIYEINPHHIKNIKTLAILMFDVYSDITVEDALDYTTVLRNQYGVSSSLIYRLPINDQQSYDSIQWGHFTRPIMHFKHSLKSSDPIRLFSQNRFSQIQEIVNAHRQAIKKSIEHRLQQLTRKYEQINKTSNRFMNFFKGSSGPIDKKYVPDELELRELADKLFLLQDYKKAYDIYKSLASKMDNRNPMIELNIQQMIQYCLAMSKYHNVKLRSDPYSSIQKYADQIFKKSLQQSRLKHLKYLVFITYVFHTFRTFNRNFVKSNFYTEIKNGFGSPLNIIALLIYEQYANMNLLYSPRIDYRKYCYDLTRVGSRFTEAKMYTYALRCLLIVQNLYKQSFSNIQKYQALQLSHLFLENKDYKQSLQYLKKAMQIYQERIQSQDLHKDDNQAIKLMDNFGRMIQSIEKHAPQYLEVLVEPNINIPILQALNIQLVDESLKYDEKSGIKWQDIGNSFLQSKELMSKGFSQKMFGNLFQTFDTGVPQQKYMIHRFREATVTQPILKKNSRTTYVNEPIRVSFYFKNPLRVPIDVQNVNLLLKNFPNAIVEMKRSENSIKAFQSAKFTFSVTPTKPGFLQFQKFEWNFMKMLVEYNIKQPDQINSDYKSCYYKLNVESPAGNLQCQGIFQESYYEGEKGQMRLKMKNVGTETITRIHLAVGDQKIFGFKHKQIPLKLSPEKEYQITNKIFLPLIMPHIQSGEDKKIIKILILYETNGKFRITRTINKFNILRVSKLQNFSCQRLSTHLHLLSFSKNIQNLKNQQVPLEYMLISKDFEIVKTQAAELAKQIKYFFFLKKGNYSKQRYNFLKSNETFEYPEDLFQPQNQFQQTKESDNKKVEIKFLWHKNDKYGCLVYKPIEISINPNGCLSNMLPLNVKLQYQQEVEHNFEDNPFLLLPITMKLKNIFQQQKFKVTVFFNESKQPMLISDAVWEGVTQRVINLAMGQQSKIEANLVVIRPGVYDISHMIKYAIENNKGKHITVSHSQYQRVFFRVKGQDSANMKQKKSDFKQFDLLHNNEQHRQNNRNSQSKNNENNSLI